MNLDFSTLYALWATDFFQKNEILLLCFGVIILLLLVIMIVVSINKTKRLKTLQQLNEVAEESNQLKNAFIANMTHEIRTPLNAIVGFTNVLAETDNLSREERMIFLKEINDNKDFLVQILTCDVNIVFGGPRHGNINVHFAAGRLGSVGKHQLVFFGFG